LLKNHKRGVDRSDKLSERDINKMYYLMNDVRRQENQIKQVNGDTEGFKRPFQTRQCKQKHRFTTTNVINGICRDCEKERCNTCNGCFTDDKDLLQLIHDKDLEQHHCQHCICDDTYQPEEPLNNTGIPLEELVRHKQGWHRKKGEKIEVTKFYRNCKFCNHEIVLSNEEDGFFHAFELTNDLHKCRNRNKRN
jgi:hypothetical protein